MRGAVMYGAGDVRVEDVPDARLIDPTDALVRVTRAAICGSDLWPYKSMPPDDAGRRMGHEFIGVIEAVGSAVETVTVGDLVVSPFLWSDGSCVFCREGLQGHVCTAAGTAGATLTAVRAKRCGFRKRTEPSLFFPSAQTTRSCLRCSRSPMSWAPAITPR